MEHFTNQAFVNRYPLSSLKIIKRTISCSLISLFFLFWPTIVMQGVLWSPLVRNLSNLTIERYISYLSPVGIWLFLLAVTVIANYFYQKQYIKTYFYNMSDNLLIIRKGVFAPQEITVPLGRIQDVYVDQDIIDRLLGIYDIHISTATAASTARAHIDGVDKKVAEELRTLILNKVHRMPHA